MTRKIMTIKPMLCGSEIGVKRYFCEKCKGRVSLPDAFCKHCGSEFNEVYEEYVDAGNGNYVTHEEYQAMKDAERLKEIYVF